LSFRRRRRFLFVSFDEGAAAEEATEEEASVGRTAVWIIETPPTMDTDSI